MDAKDMCENNYTEILDARTARGIKRMKDYWRNKWSIQHYRI